MNQYLFSTQSKFKNKKSHFYYGCFLTPQMLLIVMHISGRERKSQGEQVCETFRRNMAHTTNSSQTLLPLLLPSFGQISFGFCWVFLLIFLTASNIYKAGGLTFLQEGSNGGSSFKFEHFQSAWLQHVFRSRGSVFQLIVLFKAVTDQCIMWHAFLYSKVMVMWHVTER